jgi:hypothetical protein
LVKIDVEGFEEEVLKGMRHLLRSVGPPVLFEWRPDISHAAGLGRWDVRKLFPDTYSFFGVRHTSEADPPTFRLSLIDFDLHERFDNVLAIVVPKAMGTTARLIADREIAYQCARTHRGPVTPPG